MHIIGWSTSWKGACASRSALIKTLAAPLVTVGELAEDSVETVGM